MEYTSKSESETAKIAEEFGKSLMPGDIVALSGDLGAGKTTFTQNLAKALGVRQIVTSPTFVLLKEYQTDQTKIKRLIHVDCYRMSSEQDAESIGLLEYLSCQECVTIIEWPEKIASLLPPRTKKISFEYIDEKTRKINISS